jgi:hypothetical protein
VRNVFDFDAYSTDTAQLIREAFERKGVKIGKLCLKFELRQDNKNNSKVAYKIS